MDKHFKIFLKRRKKMHKTKSELKSLQSGLLKSKQWFGGSELTHPLDPFMIIYSNVRYDQWKYRYIPPNTLAPFMCTGVTKATGLQLLDNHLKLT